MTGFSPGRFAQRVRADVATPELAIALGDAASVEVEVTNLDEVIRSYRVAILGIDPDLVVVDPPSADLFPGERLAVTVTFVLPVDFPAGRRTVGLEISEPDEVDAPPVVVDLVLDLQAQDGVALTAEPATLEMGGTGTFIVHPVNTGNTTVDLKLEAVEPERLVEVTFDPPKPRLAPGERCVVRATARGKRPWFGLPVVRVLEVTATAGETTATSAIALMQRPRLSRRVVSLLGLLLAVTLFAFVIALSFGSVADLSEANEALLKQSLGHTDGAGDRVVPAVMSGAVTSTTGGGIDGVAVELYEQANPVIPFATTVTDQSGAYRFGAVPAGAYLLRFAVAGFGEVWYPEAETAADAEPIEVEDGVDLGGVDIALAGRPGQVAGNVLGADVVGAVVAVRIPAEAIEGSDIEPTPAVVASVELDATGRFVLPELPTPATYELAVAKPGFASEIRTVTLGPGEQRDGIEILLRRGDGILAGTIVDTAGEPVHGVVVDATDGTSETRTRSLSGDDTAGFFELRDLPTPATYTLTFTAPGHFVETATISLEESEQRDDLVIVLTSDMGSLSGVVSEPDGTPVGGVSVTVVGADLERTTESLSVGAVGSWLISGLPVPGTYTVTFRGDGLTTQALSVDLVPGPEATRTDVDAVLTSATASVSGTVKDAGGTAIGGVQITLERSGEERKTISSDEPAGAYGFDELPPGAYTMSFRRAGSTPQTLLIDLAAGQDLQLEDITLEQQARVTGVVSRDGVGEAGVGIVVYRASEYPGTVVTAVTTGAGGVFEIVGLDAPETYILEFQVPAGGPVAGSKTVFLRPGETVEVDFDL